MYSCGANRFAFVNAELIYNVSQFNVLVVHNICVPVSGVVS